MQAWMVRFLQLRIVLKNFPNRAATGEQIQNQRHPKAMAANARLPETVVRVDPDSLQEFFACHDGNLAESSARVNLGGMSLWRCSFATGDGVGMNSSVWN